MNIEKNEAKELYLYSDKTQKEIGEIVGVSDRTIRQWIKQNHWDEHKYRLEHPPLTLSEGIRLQLTNLQNNILSKPCGTPNTDEVNIMHKLILCLYRLSTMPNFDPVISNPPSGERSVGQDNSFACPPLAGAGGGCQKENEVQFENLPLSDEIFFPEKAEETTEILAPLNENKQLTELPHLSESGTEAEAESFRELTSTPLNESSNGASNKKHSNEDLSETEGSKSGSEEEERSVISNPPSGERSVGLPENTSNMETPHSISAAIEEQQLIAKLKAELQEKAKPQSKNSPHFKHSKRWEANDPGRKMQW